MYACSNCDAQYSKWVGRCLECGKWGTMIESKVDNSKPSALESSADYKPGKTSKLSEITKESFARTSTNIAELDRVLGGGIVPGSLVLLGGEPGIGKSTLCLQFAAAITNTLYISGEESIGQIKLRADRLGIKAPTLELANETAVETILATIQSKKPALAIIDSVQTIYSNEVEGEAGSPTQVRASAVKLLEAAKSLNIPLILIGHVTKEGVVAGPKTLEHLVDTVLYLEGDRHHLYRILRTVKNRFGATDEVGIFEMQERGLVEVKNPSASFLSERGDNLPGNVLTCLMEGTRSIVVEVQALVNKTVFGYPVRKASGFDINRLHLLIAVLQKRAGLHLEQYDVHLNIAGGLQADEPAADLAVAMAIASAYKDKALGHDLAAFGEVGLGGEIRPIAQADKRVKECEQLGLQRVITSAAGAQKFTAKKLKVLPIRNIQEIVKHT